MLIKTLAYEKMNDLKDALDKSSQKWSCQVDHQDETSFDWEYVFTAVATHERAAQRD